MKIKSKSRRRFLKAAGILGGSSAAVLAGASLPPFAELAKTILQSQTSAEPSSTTVNSNYVAMSLYGAPSRWVFDHWIQTKASESIRSNPMITTRFTGSGATMYTEYALTAASNGILVPWMWETTGTSARGGQRALKDLLEHMIVFRGYGTGVDGHPSNMIKQYAPVGSLGSLSGYMADQSAKLIRSVQYPAHFSSFVGYRTMLGVGRTGVPLGSSTTNLLNRLLHPFLRRNSLKRTEDLRERYADLVERAGAVLKNASENSNPGLSILNQDQTSALRYLSQGFEDLDAAWATLYSKYLGILNSTYRAVGVTGLTDRQILVPADDGNAVESRFGLMTNGVFSRPSEGVDLLAVIATADCHQIAQSLAFVEFVLTRGLSQSIDVALLQPLGLQANFSRQGASVFAPELRTFTMGFDEHFQGHMTTVLLNSCFYRALAAGLLELVDALKAARIFDRTVLHIASDFGRAPRVSGGGSDHLFDGMISSVITGRRTGGPLVLGDILRDSSPILGSSYAGTIGYKATALTPSHVASSISQLLGLRHNPWENIAQPLLAFDGTNTSSRTSGEII